MKKKLEELILDDNGKDDRLKILENGMTKYGCKPKPYEHISYSSCTASTISLESFTYVNDYYHRLNLHSEKQYVEEFQNIRDDLRNILGLKDDVDICLAPSGTDLEILPYMFIPQNSDVKNVIVGPNEVGSGTSLAVKGCVFSNVDLSKYNIKKGDKLKGFEKYNIDVINIPIRDEYGQPLKEEKILNKIQMILDKNKNSYKILHSVYHSKTGLINPSPENLLKISKNDKKAIIVVDACQFRISRESINKFLDEGCIVFITGSKFFAGPTFSAAALIPSQIRDIAAFKKDVPEGLNFLFGRELFPYRWKSVNNFEYGNNLGLLLRWKAALFEMTLFNSVSKQRIMDTIKIFNKIVKKIFKKYNEFIIYSDIYDSENNYDYLMSNTILTFGFKDKKIDFDKAKEIYQQLISKNWLNEKYPYSIHLGQPVKIKKENEKWLGTLRIALSSKFFVNYSGKVSKIQEDLIFKELDYIFSAIKKFI